MGTRIWCFFISNSPMTDTFSLEIPKTDLALLKLLVKHTGWTVHKTTTKRTAYEQALDDKKQGRINEYANADELFAKQDICWHISY